MHTPVEFEVQESFYDEGERCLLLGGEVAAGSRVEAGMKVSVGVNRSFALELPIGRVEEFDVGADRVYIAMWIDAPGDAEAAMLRSLGIEDEMLLVWDAAEPVVPARHFECGASYAELTVDLRPLRRA